METSLSADQSKLRKTSLAYCERVTDEGWVEPESGVSGLAHVLMNGRDPDDNPDLAYAARIGAAVAAPSLVLGRIASDAAGARNGLAGVTKEAAAVLAGGKSATANRGDIMSFERALVRAQMAQRSFTLALDQVSSRADMDLAPISSELDRLSAAIDEARRTADKLANRDAALEPAAS